MEQIGKVNLTPNHLTQFIRTNSEDENFRSMMATILKGMDVKYLPGVMMVEFSDGIYVFPELNSLNTQDPTHAVNFRQFFELSEDSERSSFVIRDFTKPAKITGEYPTLELNGKLYKLRLERYSKIFK